MHQMSLPISGSELRSLNDKRKKDEIEDRIIYLIESISESVVEVASRDRDKLHIIDDKLHIINDRLLRGLTSYQIDKILKGLRSNFPDCIVIYKKIANIEYTFFIDWDEHRCQNRAQIHEKFDSKMDLIP